MKTAWVRADESKVVSLDIANITGYESHSKQKSASFRDSTNIQRDSLRNE